MQRQLQAQATQAEAEAEADTCLPQVANVEELVDGQEVRHHSSGDAHLEVEV